MSRSASIAHVIHSGAIGGGPQVILDLVARVDARHTVIAPADGPLLSAAQDLGARTEQLRYAGKYSFLLSVPALAGSELRRHDLIHLHGQFAGMYGAMAARAAGRPVVYTAHFPSFITDAGLSSRVRNRLAEEIACRLSRVTVTCSEESRQEYLRRGLLTSTKVLTIYNGVGEIRPNRQPEVVRRELRVSSDDKLILAMGRFTAQKGFDLLLEAMPRVLCDCPRAVLVLAGDGDCRSELERSARRLGLAEAVRFIGFRSDGRDLLAAADVVVVPSRYEVFPLVPLEAMMAGRPLLVSDLAVLKEAVIDGQTGMVSRTDAASLAASLQSLLARPHLAAGLGEAGRIRARANFGADRMAEDYARLYARCVRRDR